MIVLINPCSTHSAKKPLPMSLLALAAVLEGTHEYRIVDGNLDGDLVARVAAIGERAALTAMAVTVMPGPQLRQAVRASRALKARFPEVPVIWGGYFPSQHADACLQDAAVDYCVRGQGEQTFVRLLDVLRLGGSAHDIPGVSTRVNGVVRHAPAAPLVPLDDLPRWPYERVPMDRYLHRHYLGHRVATHHSSFGCPFACSFCAVVAMSGRRWVAESPERVGRVLEDLARNYRADAVQFHDMDFFISEPRTVAIAERLEALGLTWWALGRVDELMRYRTATWDTLRRSGLKMVFCGAESGSTETLIRMNKGGAAAAPLTIELARRMRHYGIVPEFSFVVGNPPDPEGDLQGTLTFIRQLKSVNPATEIILYVYSPVTGPAASPDFVFPRTLDEWTSDRWQSFALRRDPRTPWSPPSIRRRVRTFETVLNAYYPTVTDPRLTPLRRRVLRAAAAWRYRSGATSRPFELDLLQRIFHYQRPETAGF